MTNRKKTTPGEDGQEAAAAGAKSGKGAKGGQGPKNGKEAADGILEQQEAMIEVLKARVTELEDKRQRALAEVENLRRRSERQQGEASAYAVTGFARDLLSVSDNLRRAMESAPGAGSDSPEHPDSATLKAFIEGVEMTERELTSAFEKHGIRPIEPMGEKFDPNLHQAMFEVDDPEAEPGTITKVIQSGFLLKDRLLRPAMVAVVKSRNNGAAKIDKSV